MILCHTFLHVARVEKPTAMRELHAIARNSRIAVGFLHGSRFFDTRNVQKRETKSDTSGHCLVQIKAIQYSQVSILNSVVKYGYDFASFRMMH